MFERLNDLVEALESDTDIDTKISNYNDAREEIKTVSDKINDVYKDISDYVPDDDEVNGDDLGDLFDKIKEKQEELRHCVDLEKGAELYKEITTMSHNLIQWLSTEENRLFKAEKTGSDIVLEDITDLFIEKDDEDDEDDEDSDNDSDNDNDTDTEATEE